MPVGQARGKPFKCDQFGVKTVVTYHPSAVMQHEDQYEEQFRADLQRAYDALQPNALPEPTKEEAGEFEAFGDYRIVVPGPECTETEALVQLDELRDYLLSAEEITFDLETEGLDPYENQVLCASFSTVPGEGYVIPLVGRYIECDGLSLEEVLETVGTRRGTPRTLWSPKALVCVKAVLKEILESDVPKSAQNGAFDIAFCREQLDIRVRRFEYDTMLSHHLYHEQKRSHDLEHLSEVYGIFPKYDVELKRWAPTIKHSYACAPEETLWTYSATDADCERRLKDITLEKLRRINPAGEWLLHEIAMPLSRALTYASSQGIPMDVEYMRALGTQIDKKVRELREHLDEVLVRGGVRPPTNYNSHTQLKRLLYEHIGEEGVKIGLGLKRPSAEETKKAGSQGSAKGESSKGSILDLLETPKLTSLQREVLTTLLELSQVFKLRSTFIGDGTDKAKAWLRYVKPNGRLHPTFHIPGTESGRLSSSRPNVQNPPGSPVVRNMIRAPADHLLVDADYSQIENRIEAYVAGCDLYIQQLQSCATCGSLYFEIPDELEEHLALTGHKRLDMHAAAAVSVLHVPLEEVTGDHRMKAKTFTHGVNFGRGPGSVAAAFGIPLDEAKAEIDNYFKVYPAIREYHDQVRALLNERRIAANVFDRVRHFRKWKIDGLVYGRPNWEQGHFRREAISMFPQGSAADILHLATIGLNDWQGVEEYGDSILIHRLLRERFGDYPARVFHHEYGAHLAISLHDSLISVVPTKHIDACKRLIHDVMYSVPKLIIPFATNRYWGGLRWPDGWYLPVAVKVRERWGEDKELTLDDLERGWSELRAGTFVTRVRESMSTEYVGRTQKVRR
jgi:DNA polymerase-1